MNKIGDFYQYSGVVHIHTTRSDGTKPLDEIVAIGRQVPGLDFMMFSDHMDLINREDGREGYYGNMLVVIGYEHNDRDDVNHYLIFGSPGVYPDEMEAREYVAAAARDKALGIIAHPIEKRSPTGKYPPYPWTSWDVDGFDGIELWNQMSEWMEKLRPYNKVPMVFSPRKSMVGPTDEVLRVWDEVNRTRRCVGIAGADAHAFPVDLWPFTVEIFPYKVHFRSLRTHLVLREPLSKDFETARRQLYRGLTEAHVFISNMRWGIADRFEFVARRDSESFTSGDIVDGYEDVTLHIKLPERARIRLIRDGVGVLQTVSDRVEYAVDGPGHYRVEAWKGKRGWIFSNHIRIGVK